MNLRVAFNQVRVLEEAGYGRDGEFIGLDIKAMRTQKGDPVTIHLENSRKLFSLLLDKVQTWDHAAEEAFLANRDYEGLEFFTLTHLMGEK